MSKKSNPLIPIVIILVIVILSLVIFLISNNFKPKVSDCRITKTDYPNRFNNFKDFNISVTVSNFGEKDCEIWDVWIPQLYNASINVRENISSKETKTYIVKTSGTGAIGGKAFDIMVRYHNVNNLGQEDSIEHAFIDFVR